MIASITESADSTVLLIEIIIYWNKSVFSGMSEHSMSARNSAQTRAIYPGEPLSRQSSSSPVSIIIIYLLFLLQTFSVNRGRARMEMKSTSGIRNVYVHISS